MSYFDPDGLLRKYGTEKATPTPGGEYRTVGQYREIEIKIDLVPLTQVEVVQSDQIFIPTGMELAKAEVYVEVAAVTGTAIDVGLVRMDRTTAVDADGILAALATATMVDGALLTFTKGAPATAGALIGSGAQATAFPAYITASRTDGTAFTAGVIRLKLFFVKL